MVSCAAGCGDAAWKIWYTHPADKWENALPLAFAEAYGEVDLELGVAATTAHRFRIGSGAKPVTATLAAVMADEGVVDLDAGIGRYLPAVSQAHRATTLRQLLTHRGGIRHYSARDWDRAAAGAAALDLHGLAPPRVNAAGVCRGMSPTFV